MSRTCKHIKHMQPASCLQWLQRKSYTHIGMLAAHSPGPLRLASSWWQKQKATLRHRNSKANQRSLPSLLSNWQSKNASRSYSSKPRRGKLLQQLPRQQRQQSKRRMHSVNGSCSMQKMILSLSQRMNLARSACHMIRWALSHAH